MRITYRWLNEFIDVGDMSPEDVADVLTRVGIEVESVFRVGEGVSGVFFGKVLSVERGGGGLLVCRVNIGFRTVLVVTKDESVEEGIFVPVAVEGAVLSGGKRVGARKFGDVVSEGLFCSEADLGLSDSAVGIMRFEGVKEGEDAVSSLGLGDWVIEYEITTNRPDTLSVLGIAREIRAVTGKPITLPDTAFSEGEFSVQECASLKVLDGDACPRYAGFVVKGIENRHSPPWLQGRLYMVGLRAINAVVDVTNYVMYELGQPLHAFDLDRLSRREVVVRRAKRGEKIVTLDGVERKLSSSDLVIADAESPVAVAGVIGGEESGCSFETKNVFLESAHFDPLTVRKTSKRLGITTDSSYRFERGADIEAVELAGKRALHLIQNLCGGEVARGCLSHYPRPYSPKVIAFSPDKVTRLIGADIPPRKSYEILSNLGFSVRKEHSYMIVKVPSWRRYDVAREVDLVEEVLRIYGMEKIKSSYPLMHSEVKRDNHFNAVLEVKEFLASLGLSEAVNYSFVGKELYEKLRLSVDKLLKIANPLSSEWVYMRDRLFPSLVRNVITNLSRHEKDVSLFEVARVFKGGEEPVHVAFALTGRLPEGSFRRRPVDFYDVKGVVESLVDFLGLSARFEPLKGVDYLHPGRSASVLVEGFEAGFIGSLHPDVLENLEISQEVFVGELVLSELLKISAGRTHYFRKIPRFPPVTRDIAVLVDIDKPVAEVERAIREAGRHIEKVRLFDVYTGAGIPEGKKSVAFSITFRSLDKTLSDEEVNRIVNDIIDRLQKIGASLRA